jgi:heme/copper-type cytochrome/quinol oxidase subunit 2
VRLGRGTTLFASAGPLLPALSRFSASGETNLQETNAIVWVMVAISAAGAIVTFAFLVYSLWKFRDPKVKHRRYG